MKKEWVIAVKFYEQNWLTKLFRPALYPYNTRTLVRNGKEYDYFTTDNGGKECYYRLSWEPYTYYRAGVEAVYLFTSSTPELERVSFSQEYFGWVNKENTLVFILAAHKSGVFIDTRIKNPGAHIASTHYHWRILGAGIKEKGPRLKIPKKLYFYQAFTWDEKGRGIIADIFSLYKVLKRDARAFKDIRLQATLTSNKWVTKEIIVEE